MTDEQLFASWVVFFAEMTIYAVADEKTQSYICSALLKNLGLSFDATATDRILDIQRRAMWHSNNEDTVKSCMSFIGYDNDSEWLNAPLTKEEMKAVEQCIDEKDETWK